MHSKIFSRQEDQAAAAAAPHRKAASLATQAGALYRKNAVYQRRAVCSNICLLSAPLLFCFVLLAIQLAVNRLILVGPEYECGCQCTKCCYNGNRSNCTSLGSGPCPYECLERNSSACGIEFSTPRQAIFCAIPHPSSWPAVLQTPPPAQRAAPYRPKAALLVTGQNPALTKTLSQNLIPKPQVTLENLLATSTYQQGFADDIGSRAKTTVAGELLSLLGFSRLGTSSRIAVTVYLETAFAGSDPSLYALWPDGTCAAMGLQGKVNTSLSTMLNAMVNVSNTENGAATLRALLAANAGDLLSGADSTTDSNQGSSMQSSARPGGIRLNCTDVVLSQQPNSLALQTTLFCGYSQARCNGTTATNAYAAAFDWADSSVTNNVGNRNNMSQLVRQGSSRGLTEDRIFRFTPDIYYNDTYGIPGQAPVVYQRIPAVLNMAINSWIKAAFGPKFSAELLGVMETPKASNKVQVDFGALLGPLLFTWVIQLLLPVMLVQLVYEKQKGLRMMMRMHGLGDGAYWLVMYSWFLLLYVVYMALFVLVGSAMGLSMLRRNSYVIQFIFYFLFGNNMIASAFLLSCFFTSSATAAAAAYMIVFGTGLVGSLLLSQLAPAGAWYATLLQLVPSFSLYRGLWEMGEYAFLAVYRNSYGMSIRSLQEPGNGMTVVWAILAAEWVLFMAAAWYAEKVLATGTGGSRKRLCFCLDWVSCFTRRQRGQQQQQAQQGVQQVLVEAALLPLAVPIKGGAVVQYPKQQQQQLSDTQQEQPDSICIPIQASPDTAADAAADAKHVESAAAAAEPSDVAAERLKVQQLQHYEGHPIVVKQLQKTYPGQDGQPPKVAVSSLDLAIKQGECFGLLGPNGAGKSTSIHMMVGLLQPSAGTALLGGHDVTNALHNVYNITGVCPQDDRLWETLTGKEHLEFYGRLKGLKAPALDAAVESSLRAVNLWSSSIGSKRPAQQLQQVRQYSGGMKRRLSVAISFVGDPLVVFLDEPSTGLDPASRRSLWDVVRSNKTGRGVLLTTHSMEEAQVLCDRLGIFVDGRLVCIGTPSDITARFGGFLVFTITVPPGQVEAAQRFVQQQLTSQARLTYSVGGTMKYELPTAEVSLSRVFTAMASLQADGSLTNSSDTIAACIAAAEHATGCTGIGSPTSDRQQQGQQQQQQECPHVAAAESATVISSLGYLEQQQQQQQQPQQPQQQQQQQQQQGGLRVLDWGVAHATLEEVFIKLAKHVGAKAGD